MSEQEKQGKQGEGQMPAIQATIPPELFTEEGLAALDFAEEEARLLRHNYIGTEHLLLGLLRVEKSMAASVLSNLGVSLANVRKAVAFIIHPGEQEVTGNIGMTPRAVVVKGMALSEAIRLQTKGYTQSVESKWPNVRIGPEHILLGLLREGEGIAIGVMERFGAKRDLVRAHLYSAMNNSGQWAEATTLKDAVKEAGTSAASKNNVVTCRIDGRDLDAIDALVEAGIRNTRSDAASWLIHAGIEANKELLDKVYGTVAEIRRLRLEVQNLVVQGNENESSPQEKGE